MAQKVDVVLVDDLDGSRASDTVTFGLDGRTYEIDLSEANAAKLRDTIATYAAAGRRTGGRARRAAPDTAKNDGAKNSTAKNSTAKNSTAKNGTATSGRSATATERARTAAIREWAREAGLDISDRGRIPNSVTEAYDNRDTRSATPAAAPAETAPASGTAEKKPRPVKKIADPFNPESVTV